MLDRLNVAVYGSLSVITTLEFFEHHFAKVGHRLAPYDPTLSSHHCCRHQTRERVCREAASFKRACRKLWGRVSTLRTTFASQKERWPAGPPRGLERLREPSLQKLSKLRGGLELWDRLESLECRGERIRETPNGPRVELLSLSLEVEVVNRTREVFGRLQLRFDERFVDDYLGGEVRQFTPLPGLHLLSHRLRNSLHSVNADRETVDEPERLRGLGEHRGEHDRDNVSEINSAALACALQEQACAICAHWLFLWRTASLAHH